MCDKELLVGYLYGELSTPERAAFDSHLASCAGCRSEVEGLRGTRTYLEAWTPPEPELGYQVVRRSEPMGSPSTARWWGLAPAWGLAAAAMLVGAISAAIANVEVTAASGGITVRTGWNRSAVQVQADGASSVSAGELQKVTARLAELETQLAQRQSGPAAIPASAVQGRMSDAELVRLFRQMIEQSEERQQGVLARQILQVNRDFDIARRTDFERLGRGMEQIQRTTVETFQRQRALEDHFVRVGLQR
jgi:anti-sigma factor RsiW